MIRKKRTIITFTILLIIGLTAYFAKDKFSCFKINYQLQHSDDVEVVKTDSAQYFEQFKNKDGVKAFQMSLIEFGGQGCRPCMRMDTVLEKLSLQYGSKLNIHVVRLSDRANRKIAKYFDVQMIPTQLLMDKQGLEVFRHTGFLSKDDLQKEIDKYM